MSTLVKYIQTTALTIFSLSTSFAAHAGDFRGNGGHGVVFRTPATATQPATIKVETMDVYEGREVYNDPSPLIPNLGPADLAPELKANLALDRLAKIDPVRAEIGRLFVNAFQSKLVQFYGQRNAEGKVIKEFKLPYVDDANPQFLPTGSKDEQIAIRPEYFYMDPIIAFFYAPPMKNHHSSQVVKPISVNAALWDALDNDNKAVLMLHEFFYADIGGDTSTIARHFVMQLVDGRSFAAFDRVAQDPSLLTTYLDLLGSYSIKHTYTKLYLDYHRLDANSAYPHVVYISPEITFYSPGHPKTMWDNFNLEVSLRNLYSTNNGQPGTNYLFSRYRSTASTNLFQLHENGVPATGFLSSYYTHTWNGLNYSCSLGTHVHIKISPNLTVENLWCDTNDGGK